MKRFIAAAVVALAIPAALVASAGDSNPSHYTVDPADSWQSIAVAHGITADQLQLANNLAASTSNTAHPRTGWVLHVPEVVPSSTTSSTSSTAPPVTSTTTTLPPSTTTSVPPTTSSTTTTTAAPTTTTTVAPTTTAPATTQPPTGSGFSADFSTAADLNRFDWQIFHGGIDPFTRSDQPQQWRGDHNMACDVPTTQRDVHMHGEVGPGPVSNTGEFVWWCAPGNDPAKGHVMTSTSLVAYGHIDFAPRQSFNNVRRVCWDQNWTEQGGRKWTQVTVVPEALFQANGGRFDYVMPFLQEDVAVNGERLAGGAFMLSMLRASTQVFVGQGFEWTDFGGFQTTDKARRFRQCIVDNGTNVTLELERLNGSDVRTVPGATLPDGPVRVIFQDVTYDSLKGDLSFDQAQQTNTWHWDNVQIVGG